MANLKTNEDYYNKDNFVERDGVMQEIMVSVTVAEYRDLVASKAQLQQKVWDQNERIRKLEAENVDLRVEVEKRREERHAMRAEIDRLRLRNVASMGSWEGSDEDADE